MTTEKVMKLGKRKIVVFFCSTFLSTNLSTMTVWKECKQTILPMYRIIKEKRKKKIIKNQFELNSEKCIKMHMSGPKIHIELSVISR